MLIKRLKLFGIKEKRILDEVKRYFRNFGNARGNNKNLKIINKLGAKDSLTLSKILPNHLTNPELLNKDGKIEIPEETWNIIKKAGYFSGRKTKKITRDDFNKYLNTSKTKNKVHTALGDEVNIDLPEYMDHVRENKPELYKKLYIDKDPHTRSLLAKQWVFEREAVKNRELFNDKNSLRIQNRVNSNKRTVSRKELDALKDDKGVRNANVNFHESDYLSGPYQSHFHTSSANSVKKRKAAWNNLEKSGLTDRNKFNESFASIEKNKKIINDIKKKYHLTDEEALEKVTKKARKEAAKAEYFGKLNGDPTTSTVFLPKGEKRIGSPSHEVGHAMEKAHGKNTPKSIDNQEVARLKNELRYTDNHAGPIQQLGNEGMASLRGVSRYKGENKKQATKNLLNSYATYINVDGKKIIRGEW
jgi:hypothetical protein